MSAWSRPGPPPPGEPYRSQPGPGDVGPPSDPWSQSPTVEPWNRPAGDWGGPGTYAVPTYPGPPGTPTPPAAPPPPRRNLGLYALVAVLVLLAAAGAGYALYVLSGTDGTPAAGPSGNPTAPAGSPGASTSPRDTIGMSAAVAAKDDCLVNDGTAAQTQMRIVRCDDEEAGDPVYKVLAVVAQRVAGEDDQARNAAAQQICADVEGYTHHYYEVGEQSSFVLCMVEQS